MATRPYLHFDGTCTEALAFYAAIHGGTGLQPVRYRDVPDLPEGAGGEPQAPISVMQSARDMGTTERWLDAPGKDGDVVVAFGPAFVAPGFGMLEDRFGSHWMIAAMPET